MRWRDPWGLSARLDTIIATLNRMVTQMSALDDAIAKLQTDDTALTSVVQAAVTEIQSIPGQITAAVNAALAQGATPQQLAGLTQLSADLEARANDLNAALQNAPKPAA